MHFFITIFKAGKEYKMKVERSMQGESNEVFKISAGSKCLVVNTNRRMLKVLGKVNEQPQWDVVSGTIRDRETYEETITEIEKYMKAYEVKYPGYTYDTRKDYTSKNLRLKSM